MCTLIRIFLFRKTGSPNAFRGVRGWGRVFMLIRLIDHTVVYATGRLVVHETIYKTKAYQTSDPGSNYDVTITHYH